MGVGDNRIGTLWSCKNHLTAILNSLSLSVIVNFSSESLVKTLRENSTFEDHIFRVVLPRNLPYNLKTTQFNNYTIRASWSVEFQISITA